MDTTTLEPISAFSEHLKQFTRTTHESLDRKIMNFQPFDNRENYKCFLRMQLRLHKVTEALYLDTELNTVLANLKDRCRMDAILQDSKDLGLSEDIIQHDLDVADTISIPSKWHGIGWLYTHEGSTLGAAFLLKHAKKDLGLTESLGAQHLAAHSDGRGLNWRKFKQMLDDMELTAEQREVALLGAQDAFTFVRKTVSEVMV